MRRLIKRLNAGLDKIKSMVALQPQKEEVGAKRVKQIKLFKSSAKKRRNQSQGVINSKKSKFQHEQMTQSVSTSANEAEDVVETNTNISVRVTGPGKSMEPTNGRASGAEAQVSDTSNTTSHGWPSIAGPQVVGKTLITSHGRPSIAGAQVVDRTLITSHGRPSIAGAQVVDRTHISSHGRSSIASNQQPDEPESAPTHGRSSIAGTLRSEVPKVNRKTNATRLDGAMRRDGIR